MTKKPQIYLIAGPKGSGKSTLAELLVQERRVHQHAARTEIVPFAALLKSMLYTMFEGVDQQISTKLYGDSVQRAGRIEGVSDWKDPATVRMLAQTLGTEWGRNMVHPNIWLMLWYARHEVATRQYKDENYVVLVPDCRFTNEVAYLRNRTEAPMIFMQRGEHDASDRHESEQEMWTPAFQAHVTMHLQNDGNEQQLRQSIYANPMLRRLVTI